MLHINYIFQYVRFKPSAKVSNDHKGAIRVDWQPDVRGQGQ